MKWERTAVKSPRPLFLCMRRWQSVPGCAFLSAQDIPGVENYPYDYMHLSPDAHKALAEHLAKWIPDYFSEEGK